MPNLGAAAWLLLRCASTIAAQAAMHNDEPRSGRRAGRRRRAGEQPMQLDLFEHSRDVMLRNDAIDALARHEPRAARAACERLAEERPADEALPALRALVEGVEGLGGAAIEDHDALARAWRAVEALRAPCERVFRAQACQWLAPLWEDLAARARNLPLRADAAPEHAAPLWLAAGNWSAAARATEAIESWRRIPAPLAWMIEARLHLLGLQACWPLVAELGWLAPARLDALLHRSREPMLAALVQAFDERFEGAGDTADAAWFAAWVLTERPEVAEQAGAAWPARHEAPERAFRTLLELIRLERQGRQREIVERRKALRELHPALFAAYMKTR